MQASKRPDRKCVCQLDELQNTQPCSCLISVVCMKVQALTDLRSGQKLHCLHSSSLSAFTLTSSYETTPKFVSVHVALQDCRSTDVNVDLRAKAPGTMSTSVCGLRREERGGLQETKKVIFFGKEPSINGVLSPQRKLVLTKKQG